MITYIGDGASAVEAARLYEQNARDAELARLRTANAALADALREAVRVLAFGIEDEVIPRKIVLQLCIDPDGTVRDLRRTLEEHAKP